MTDKKSDDISFMDDVTFTSAFHIIESSDWSCDLCDGFVITPCKGGEPNWFWRKMQYLILGFRWKRNNDKK